MKVAQSLPLVMLGAVLAGGCAPSDSDDMGDLFEDDNTASVEQRLSDGYTRPNNQVLQGCNGYINASGYIEKLQGLKLDSTDSSGVQSWSLQWVTGLNGTQSTPVQLTFAPSGTALPGRNVKELRMSTANKGWFVVTWFNGSGTNTTTTTMNSANPNGDRLVITMPAINGRDAAYYQISSQSNSATSGRYRFFQSGSLDFNLATMTSFNWLCQETVITPHFIPGPTGGTASTTVVYESYLIPFAMYRWDPISATRLNDSTFISFGSPPDALGGCEDWGYGPWGSHADKFDACTRAKRADICGDGRSWTWNHSNFLPVDIQIWDNANHHPMSPHTDSNMEAWYTSTGASCINTVGWRAPQVTATDFGDYYPYDPVTLQRFDYATSCGRQLYWCINASPGKIGIGRPCNNGVCR